MTSIYNADSPEKKQDTDDATAITTPDPQTPSAQQDTAGTSQAATTEADEQDLGNPWASDELDTTGMPIEDDPAAAPEADTPAENPDTQETDDEAIERLTAEYKGDIKGLAKAVLELRKLRDRQGNELGELRKKTQTPEKVDPDQVTAGNDDASVHQVPIGTSAATPETPAQSSTPASPIITADQLPGFGLTPEDMYDPAKFEHDENGWPIYNGEPRMPVDEWEVGYTPESVWDERLRSLEEETGSAAVAFDRVSRERAAEQASINKELQEKYVIVRNFQFNQLKPVEMQLASRFSSQYEEPVARKLASDIAAGAVEIYDKLAASGMLNKAQLKDPATMQNIVRQLDYELYNSGRYSVLADEVRQKLTGSSAPLAVKSAPGLTPPAGGLQSTPVIQKPVSEKAKAIANRTGLDAETAAKFSDPHLVFD